MQHRIGRVLKLTMTRLLLPSQDLEAAPSKGPLLQHANHLEQLLLSRSRGHDHLVCVGGLRCIHVHERLDVLAPNTDHVNGQVEVTKLEDNRLRGAKGDALSGRPDADAHVRRLTLE